MSDESPGPGWWQASDGTWNPPTQAPGAHADATGPPQDATAGEHSTTAQRPGVSHVDVAGAVLVVVGIVGGIAWAWGLVRVQFTADEPGSLGDRLDLLAGPTPVLLLAAVVAGLGIGLRSFAAERGGSSGRSVLGNPVGPMLLALTAALVVLVGGAAIVVGDDEETIDLDALDLDPPLSDDVPSAALPSETLPSETLPSVSLPPILLPEVSISPELLESYTLEVHSDGCGVFRSGEIGDDLTWVVTDQDGFQVLGRNAAGETQYRYFRPGTYTVTLETWGGSYYVDVSNEVTITC